eukprot:scaffold7392_cov286-Pinguiococcus_pyrenoidosus.AAC.1
MAYADMPKRTSAMQATMSPRNFFRTPAGLGGSTPPATTIAEQGDSKRSEHDMMHFHGTLGIPHEGGSRVCKRPDRAGDADNAELRLRQAWLSRRRRASCEHCEHECAAKRHDNGLVQESSARAFHPQNRCGMRQGLPMQDAHEKERNRAQAGVAHDGGGYDGTTVFSGGELGALKTKATKRGSAIPHGHIQRLITASDGSDWILHESASTFA